MLKSQIRSTNQQLSKADLLRRIQQLEEENRSIKAQRAEREQKIVRNDLNLNSVVENTEDVILSIDPNYKVLVANSAACSLIRKRWDVIVRQGDRLSEKLPQDQFLIWKTHFDLALEGETFKKLESFELEGQTYFFEFAYAPIKEARCEITGITVFAKDITKRHQQQEEIKNREQLLASINYSIKEGIFRTTTTDGIIYINKHFVEMFGYDSVEEMLPIDPGDLYVDPARRDFFRSFMQENTYFENEEAEYKRKDGSTFWGLVSSIKATDENGNVYFDGAIRDISEIREARQALQDQNTELVKVNRELDKLVYSTSHDLRAPLVSVMGLINIAKIETDTESRNRYFDLMSKSLNKLDDFIKDIMGYSRNSRAEIRREKIDFHQLIDEAFNSLRYGERYKNIQKKVSIFGEGDLYSDPTRLQIIFNNLISNACRYSDLTKDESFVEIKVTHSEGSTEIVVKDNGIGIAPRYMDKIFDMFYRATNTSDGSGIGLYIVREAVHKLGGIINVDSALGAGTSFHMELSSLQIENQEEAILA
ncbi:MAG: ATP-binding protein [Bacteroidota bacterium]